MWGCRIDPSILSYRGHILPLIHPVSGFTAIPVWRAHTSSPVSLDAGKCGTRGKTPLAITVLAITLARAASSNKCIDTSSKCITTSSKQLLVASG